MDLRQMEYLLAVVEHGGINRAAAALHVAQPSLSQAIRKLERDVGAELFHRVGRGLVLAPAGEALIGPARTILREAEAAKNTIRTMGQGSAGRVDIVTLSDTSMDPLSVWVARFCVGRPDVRFRIEERDTASEVLYLVRSGDCEIGVLAMPIAGGELVVEEYFDQHFVLVCPPGTDEHWPEPTPIELLAGVPLVMGEKDTVTREYIDGSLRAHGVEPHVVVEVPQRGSVLPMVLAGGGAAIVPLRIAIDARPRGGVVRDLEPRLSRQVGMVHRQGRVTATAAEFLEHSRQSLDRWVHGIDRRRGEGLSRIEAVVQAAETADERNYEESVQATLVRPHDV